MRTIETQVTVTPDGQLTVQVPAPADIPPGEHRAVLVIEEHIAAASARTQATIGTQGVEVGDLAD